MSTYGDVSVLPTRYFVQPVGIGEEISFEINRGKTLFIRLKSISDVDDSGHRDVTWELNGEHRVVRVADASAAAAGVRVKPRRRADKGDPSHVAAPMPGVVVDVRVTPGAVVKAGTPLAVLSAMKMESVVVAARDGVVREVAVAPGQTLEAGDLVVVVE